MKWILILAILATGCAAYSEEKVIFVVSNHSSDTQIFFVNGVQTSTVPPSTPQQLVTEVPVPLNPVTNYYPSGPSQVDKVTSVTLVFKNQRTGKLSRDASCSAGAKVKVAVALYEQPPYEPYAQCGY